MKITKIAATSATTLIPTLILATIITFLLQRLIPGDVAQAIAGEYATPERLAEIRHNLGLDQSMIAQYFSWVSHALTGDLGISLRTGESVTDLVLDRLPVTAILGVASLLVAVSVGVTTGVIAAVNRGGPLDRWMTTGATLGIAIPSFWLGMVLISVFALTLRWFPGPGGVSLSEDPTMALWGLVLPAISLGAVGAAEICRQVRSAMIESLSSDYVRTHTAKGLSRRSVVCKHALRNSSLPLTTVIGLLISKIIGGAVVVEAVFGLHGIGSLVADATYQRDYPIVQGVVFVAALMVLATNLLVDISYRLLDPRIA